MSRDDDAIIAYEFLRDEIKREDLLTHQRLSASLAFQGILMAAMALVLSNGWLTLVVAKDGAEASLIANLKEFRMQVMFLIGVAGWLVGFGSVVGVHAAQRSLRDTKQKWEQQIADNVIALHPSLPQAYGQQGAFSFGRTFPYIMTGSFVLIWSVYIGLLACNFLHLTLMV